MDALTGLPGGPDFRTALGAAGDDGWILHASLDHFRRVNDEFGVEVGDEVLIELGRRLLFRTPPGVTVARYAGDEFVLLLPGLEPFEVGQACASVMWAIRTPFNGIGPSPVHLSATAGLSTYGRPPRAESAAERARRDSSFGKSTAHQRGRLTASSTPGGSWLRTGDSIDAATCLESLTELLRGWLSAADGRHGAPSGTRYVEIPYADYLAAGSTRADRSPGVRDLTDRWCHALTEEHVDLVLLDAEPDNSAHDMRVGVAFAPVADTPSTVPTPASFVISDVRAVSRSGREPRSGDREWWEMG